MDGNDKRHENILIAAILLCTCLILVLDIVIVKNVLSCGSLLERTEMLSAKAEKMKAAAETQQMEAAAGAQQENAIRENNLKESNTRESHIEESENLPEGIEAEDEPSPDTLTHLDLNGFLSDAEAMGELWAVSVMDLSDGTAAGIHDDISMQSASVIKVFIMAAVYDRVCYPADAESAIYAPEQYEGELKELLTNMITVSDNNAANRLVELLGNGDFQAGKEVVNAFCRENGYLRTSLGRRFLEENPQDDNYTTSGDCLKILQDIYNGNCVCAEASEKMLAMLQNQTVTTKIPSGLPEEASCANKTGEMPEGYGLGCIENDIAIVYGENRDYILCVLANNLQGRNEGAKERIAEISGYVYEKLQYPQA